MNLKKISERRAERRRHRHLMEAAQHIVRRHALDDSTDTASPAKVAALAFGWHGLRVAEDEALDYLNAVLADRGFPLLPAPETTQETGT
ncbi:hypothetical protein [Streptomyces sp. UG1]|uniref:hypothetical protein n=1 Tax=Streptomyces sp. UG1 TaxID=3417652 RepID=UPI003CF55F7F